jgi:hypothetical protein
MQRAFEIEFLDERTTISRSSPTPCKTCMSAQSLGWVSAIKAQTRAGKRARSTSHSATLPGRHPAGPRRISSTRVSKAYSVE